MLNGVKAGCCYFAMVFAVGFLLGTLRVLAIVPRIGEPLAVLIELPVMLAVSWFACSWIIKRFSVPQAVAPRRMMGGMALLLLMTAEIGVSVFGFKRTVAEHFESYRTATAIMGLLGQIAFALLPIVHLSLQRRNGGHK